MGIRDAQQGRRRPVLQLLSILLIAVSVAAQTDPCVTNPLPPKEVNINFSTSRCKLAWNQKSFTVRYTDNATTLSMVVSVAKENRWYAIGFNKRSSMIGASAMVTWVDQTSSEAQIKQYYLGGQVPGLVKIDSKMNFTHEPQVFVTDSIYMAFQIDKVASAGVSFDSQLYAYGKVGELPLSSGQFEQHEQMTGVKFDYSSGTTTVTYSDPASLRRNHGIVNIVGWGILLPVGAIVARYCKRWDPAWFYLHISTQVMGYILIAVGLVLGDKLKDKVPNVDADTHSGLGIFVFVLATLQVTALLIRPKKDAKIRRYWNFYHHWAGRIALVIAVFNIFIGINLANGGRKWKASYGLVLVIEVAVIAILEILYRVNRAADRDSSASALQLGGGNFQQDYPNSSPPAYDNYRSQI